MIGKNSTLLVFSLFSILLQRYVIQAFSIASSSRIAEIINVDPAIVTIENLLSQDETKHMLSTIQTMTPIPTTTYQEDVFSKDAYEKEDAFFDEITQPFQEMIPSECLTPIQKFVHVFTNYSKQIDAEDVIKGANIIQRREALERWKSEEGQAILNLTSSNKDTGFQAIGKRYQMPQDILQKLEAMVPDVLYGSWSLQDATIVKYQEGDSQVPHLDNCDCTILICLEASEEGGETCFPLLDFNLKNIAGNAHIFFSTNAIQENDSKNVLSLHHGGAIRKGEKVVVQLMLNWEKDDDISGSDSSWLSLIHY